ncbi:MAG: hypothetical protein GX087_06535 [Desulfobulbaceae bacterium]|nr:hypothetical protein [Desulfobulbaceae bacterium]
MLYIRSGAALLLALLLVLPACTLRQEERRAAVTQGTNARQAQLLAQRYPIIVVEPVAISVDMAKAYPLAARSCQSSAINTLKAKKAFELVHHTKPDQPGSTALLVRSKITDMRLATKSSGPRGGATAGNTYLNLDVQLVDATTEKVLQQKQLSSTALSAPINEMQNKDKDIAVAMGAILGEYVFAAMPAP